MPNCRCVVVPANEFALAALHAMRLMWLHLCEHPPATELGRAFAGALGHEIEVEAFARGLRDGSWAHQCRAYRDLLHSEAVASFLMPE